MRNLAFIIIVYFLIQPQYVIAYETLTHEIISNNAVKKSKLTLDPMLSNYLDIDITDEFPNSQEKPLSVVDLISGGAVLEDNDVRPVNHFYDPITGKTWFWLIVAPYTSPDWALADVFEPAGQDFAYRHARNYFYSALTSSTQPNRDKYFGLTFQTLGQVIHHVQDMAQPQHTRLDLHKDTGVIQEPDDLFDNPSVYEYFTNKDEVRKRLPFDGYSAVSLSTPRKYWDTEDGRGLAEYSNRGFVSAGTNFDTQKYSKPAYNPLAFIDEEVTDLFRREGEAIPSMCATPGSCYMRFFQNEITGSENNIL